MENTLVYQAGSETIRQMPQNYCIAYKRDGAWVCEPDLAADKELSARVFNALFDHSTKYGDGLNLLSKVTPNSDFRDVLNHDEKFRYQLLGRLQADCDYYLNSGKCSKHFWAGSEKGQIEMMFLLYESFPEDKKPEWLTLEQIKEYEKKIIG